MLCRYYCPRCAQRQVRRLVRITGVGAGDSRGRGGILYDRLFNPSLLRRVYVGSLRSHRNAPRGDLCGYQAPRVLRSIIRATPAKVTPPAASL